MRPAKANRYQARAAAEGREIEGREIEGRDKLSADNAQIIESRDRKIASNRAAKPADDTE